MTDDPFVRPNGALPKRDGQEDGQRGGQRFDGNDDKQLQVNGRLSSRRRKTDSIFIFNQDQDRLPC